MKTDEILALIDGLRARRVPAIRLKQGDFELELAALPPLGADELPSDQAARDALLRDPSTPQTLKDRIEEEDERDLYAAS